VVHLGSLVVDLLVVGLDSLVVDLLMVGINLEEVDLDSLMVRLDSLVVDLLMVDLDNLEVVVLLAVDNLVDHLDNHLEVDIAVELLDIPVVEHHTEVVHLGSLMVEHRNLVVVAKANVPIGFMLTTKFRPDVLLELLELLELGLELTFVPVAEPFRLIGLEPFRQLGLELVGLLFRLGLELVGLALLTFASNFTFTNFALS